MEDAGVWMGYSRRLEGIWKVSGSHQFRTGQVRTSHVGTCQLRIVCKVGKGQFGTCQVRAGQVEAGRFWIGQVRTGQVGTCQVVTGQVSTGQIGN